VSDAPIATALVPVEPQSQDVEIDRRLREHAHAARGAYATQTVRRLKSNALVYSAWCSGRGVSHLPATAQTVADFVDDQARTKRPGSVRCLVSTIAHMHRAASLPDPTKEEVAKLALRRMHRDKGRRQKQAHGITYDLRNLMLKHSQRGMIGKRDRALLALAYDSGCRRSELVGFDVENYAPQPDGSATILLRRSKTDQEGQGSVIALPNDTAQLIAEWITAAGITEGALFRAVNAGGKVGLPLREGVDPGRAVARAFRKLARRAGLDDTIVTAISGHSTRVGMAQDLTAKGFELPAIMRAGRWKTPVMVARYGENQEAKRGAMMQLAAMQGRV
jgi:site-specific recombinase XerD